MYLARLTLFGFKSFAQKIDVDFKGGITAVVGPNGCGKTNIVDAIRWALGEQRPGAMRSSRMEDVIFTGSRSRKPLGMAEVSLTITNDKKILPVEFSEVTVTRRLFRSGESDYFLNKIPCRLMDIHTLFMDTGLGAHAYSVIEQGMIDTIISDKTEDRRHLFEEASGITRYKVRRKSAWSKLQSIQADLQRIDDIVTEVERQVQTLQRQVRKARLYKTYADQVRDMEILLGRFRYFDLAEKARPALEEMRFLKEDVEVRAGDLARTEARLEQVRADLVEQEQALSTINAELSGQQALTHAKDRDVSVARESIRGIEVFLERAARGRSEVSGRLEVVLKTLGEVDAETGIVLRDCGEADRSLAQVETEAKQAQEGLDHRRAQVDAEKARLIDILHARGQQAARLERARAERDGQLGRLTDLKAERETTATRAEVVTRSAEIAAREIRSAEGLSSERRTERDRLADALARTRERILLLQGKQNEARRQSEGNRARVHLLERLREGFEGYSRGVRSLALDSPFTPRIQGVLADLIDADPLYTRAVESALGSSLEALVVSGTLDAEEAIRYLREADLGTAAFWPMACNIDGSGATAWEVPGIGGVIGKATDLVRCEPRFAPLVHLLLGKTLIVQDMATALSLAPALGDTGIDQVTLDGDLVTAEGMIAGGSSGHGKGQVGLIGRKREIDGLRLQIEEADEQIADLEKEGTSAEAEAKGLSGQIEAVDGQIEDLRNRMAEREKQRYNDEAEGRRLQERVLALGEEQDRIRAKTEELRSLVLTQEEELGQLDAKREDLERHLETCALDLEAAEGDLRSRLQSAGAARVRATSLKSRGEELSREALRLGGERSSLTRQIEEVDREVADATRRKQALDTRRALDEEEMRRLHEGLAEVERRRDGQTERNQELAASARSLEDDIRGRQRTLNENRDRLHSLELSLQELKAKADALRERLSDSHRIDVKEAGPPPDDGAFSADVQEKRIYEFQERMRRLGAVNMAALEDYDIQKERYEFLTKQRDDLLQAEDTLKRTIARIDRTARSRFLDTFEKVRENFRKTFVAFFPGGEADLAMDADQDPLESHIHITARPQGKRLQHINLLSGGERALTAIALLFAIYLVKPSPFCILDEVDAPLDDANIDRFTRVLSNFAQDTQFIVVTHNKKTMGAAESLHGVTMEEPGVSKLVSVRIGRNGRSGLNGDKETPETAAVSAN